MGLFGWLKSTPRAKPASSAPAPAVVEALENATAITFAGAKIVLTGRWVPTPSAGASFAEFRGELHEKLVIQETRFPTAVGEEELAIAVEHLAYKTRNMIREIDAVSAVIDPVDFRKGNGQVEARVFGILKSKNSETAWLCRGDGGRVVTFSIFRFHPLPGPTIGVYGSVVFDLVQFEATR
jgi:hypothetical protein